jgi:hypothetical protein
VERILAILRDNELAAIQDPMGLARYIYPCETETFKQDALSKIKLLPIVLRMHERQKQIEILRRLLIGDTNSITIIFQLTTYEHRSKTRNARKY